MTIRWLRAFEQEALASYVPKVGDLAIYRILFASFLLLLHVPVAMWLPLAPKAFFAPPLGPASFFTATPSASVLLGLNLLLVLLVSLLLVGWRTPLASVGTGVTLLILKAFEYSLGKIDHDIFLVIVPLLLAFSGWGRTLSIDSRRHPARPGEDADAWPLALLGLVIGFAMFTAGWAKVTTGWLDPTVDATYGHLARNYLFTGRETWAGGLALGIDSRWFWKPADWAAVALETGFLFAAIRRQWLCLWMALATLFHIGVLVLFAIPFSANVMAYGAFVGYTALPAFRSLPTRTAQSTAWWIALAGAVALGAVATLRGETTANALHLPLDYIVIWVGAAGGVWYLGWILMRSRAYHEREAALVE